MIAGNTHAGRMYIGPRMSRISSAVGAARTPAPMAIPISAAAAAQRLPMSSAFMRACALGF